MMDGKAAFGAGLFSALPYIRAGWDQDKAGISLTLISASACSFPCHPSSLLLSPLPWEELDKRQRAVQRAAGKPWVGVWGQLGSAPRVPVALLREGTGSRQQRAPGWQLGRDTELLCRGILLCPGFQEQLNCLLGLEQLNCLLCLPLLGILQEKTRPAAAGQGQEPALPWGKSWPGPPWCVLGRIIHCLVGRCYVTHLQLFLVCFETVK